MTDFSAARRKFVDWVKQSLTGEELKDNLLIETNPFNRYTTGILYPMGTEYEVENESKAPTDDVLAEEPAKKTKYQPPSSMGFSFYVDSSLKSLRVFYSATSFKKRR